MNNKIKPYFTSATLDTYSKLQTYDFHEFNGRKYQAVGAQFNEKIFENMRFKNGKYNQCYFNNCIFRSAGLAGTHFLSCQLFNFEIIDCNMQFCDFSQNSILEGISESSLIRSSNMSQSMFQNLIIRNVNFKSTTISQARFINISFENVVWESCTLQDNIFDNVIMEDISLIGCNLEYSDFRNVTFTNTKLPFHQIPYAFGLLNCLKNFPDDILIGSVSSDYEPIKPADYIGLLPDLFTYYLNMNEYFPAINIALFNEDTERVNELIETALCYYIESNDFRNLKGVCKLIANYSEYDTHFMTQLYFRIIKYYNQISVSDYERYQYAIHINEIKKILTDFSDVMPKAQLYLKTNITSNDTEKLGFFLKVIEQCLVDQNIPNEYYSVEVRHNSSPLSFWITISQQNPQVMIDAISVLMSVITENPSFLQEAFNIAVGVSTIGSFVMQIAQAFKEKKKATTSISSDVAASKIQYIKQKSTLLKEKQISVNITLSFFNFSYATKKKLNEQKS